MISRLGLRAVFVNLQLHVQRFWLRTLDPLAPAPLLRKHLIKATDLERKAR